MEKHSILKNGCYIDKVRHYNEATTCREDRWIYEEIEKPHTNRPNKFYYIVPTGMISAAEVPAYAGLYYYEEYSITVQKEAPFIHKTKLDLRPILCDKFYHYWLTARQDLRLTKMELDNMNENYEELENKLKSIRNGTPM